MGATIIRGALFISFLEFLNLYFDNDDLNNEDNDNSQNSVCIMHIYNKTSDIYSNRPRLGESMST